MKKLICFSNSIGHGPDRVRVFRSRRVHDILSLDVTISFGRSHAISLSLINLTMYSFVLLMLNEFLWQTDTKASGKKGPTLSEATF